MRVNAVCRPVDRVLVPAIRRTARGETDTFRVRRFALPKTQSRGKSPRLYDESPSQYKTQLQKYHCRRYKSEQFFLFLRADFLLRMDRRERFARAERAAKAHQICTQNAHRIYYNMPGCAFQDKEALLFCKTNVFCIFSD